MNRVKVYMEQLSLVHIDLSSTDHLARSHEAEPDLLAAGHSTLEQVCICVTNSLSWRCQLTSSLASLAAHMALLC